jgi:hypothetical protein
VLKTEVFHAACKSNFKGVLSFAIFVNPQSDTMFRIIASVKPNNNKDEITFQQIRKNTTSEPFVKVLLHIGDNWAERT